MLSEQRYKEILNLLEKEGSVKAITLCKLFDASRETIRRDLENMEARNMLKRIHGGAMRWIPGRKRRRSIPPLKKDRGSALTIKKKSPEKRLHISMRDRRLPWIPVPRPWPLQK